MNNSTSKVSIDHLIMLGFPIHSMGQKWRNIYKLNPVGKCKYCGHKIRITDPISKILNLKYYTNRYIPEVHWIFDFNLYYENNTAIADCATYIKSLSNTKKKAHIYPCCYNCWNIAVNESKDYNLNSVISYYKTYELNNENYVNWNMYKFNELTDPNQIQAKIKFNYDYIIKWCNMVGICSYTNSGHAYCGKYIGKCSHTNNNIKSLQSDEEQTYSYDTCEPDDNTPATKRKKVNVSS